MDNEGLLTPLQRERRDLGYLTRGPEFGVNFLTALHGPPDEDGLGPAPKVTLYAQPTALVPGIDLAKLLTWLGPTARGYDPVPDLPFVPPYRRGIVDGVLADPNAGREECFRRFIAIRRSATVEYGAYCSWWYPVAQKVWLISEKHVILQFGQLLRFLDDFATSFDLPRSWTVWCNARDLKGRCSLVSAKDGQSPATSAFDRRSASRSGSSSSSPSQAGPTLSRRSSTISRGASSWRSDSQRLACMTAPALPSDR